MPECIRRWRARRKEIKEKKRWEDKDNGPDEAKGKSALMSPEKQPSSPEPHAAQTNLTEDPDNIAEGSARFSTDRVRAEAPTPQELWDEAYQTLKEDKDNAKLLKGYFGALETVLRAEQASAAVETDESDLSNMMNDPSKRQELLTKLVEQGQKRVSRASDMKLAVGKGIQYFQPIKQIVDIAVRSVPQAALPWAGVCLGLEILNNPSEGTASHRAGITYVCSRMEWYCALSDHLLSKEGLVVGTRSFESVVGQIRQATIMLYKELLLYQMKSVCSYYRNQGLTFLREIGKLDDWDGGLSQVTNAESVVREYANRHCKEHLKGSLAELVDSGNKLQQELGQINMTLRDFFKAQIEARKEDKDAECLQDLRAVDPQYDVQELEGKKDKLLKKSYEWILETEQYNQFTNWSDRASYLPQSRILWINGSAGTGKTMLVMGIVAELSNQLSAITPLLSYFFCQETDANRNTAEIILRSLVWQLLVQQPHLIHHLESLRKNSGPSLLGGDRAFYVLSGVFKKILEDPGLSPVYLAVDALDECNASTPGRMQLFDLIFHSVTESQKVKWLLSSRPDIPVDFHLAKANVSMCSISLDTQCLQGPVGAYIAHKLDNLQTNKDYTEKALQSLSDELHSRASDTFLWVALAFKEIEHVDYWDALDVLQSIPSGLSQIYSHIMSKLEKGTDKNVSRCKNVLIAALLAYRPLSLIELGAVAGLETKIPSLAIVQKCGSFLTVSDGVVKLIHQSAKDYLLQNCQSRLGLTPAQGHLKISSYSISAMQSTLKENIYDLGYKGFPSQEIVKPDPDPLAAVRYACVFWIHHFCRGKDESQNITLADDGQFFQFLKKHLLHWLEAVSLLEGMSDIIRFMNELQAEVELSDQSEATAFYRDMIRFIPFYRQMIDEAPLQAYAGALAFAPKESVVRQTFIEQVKTWIPLLPEVETDWSPCLYTLHETGLNLMAMASTRSLVVSSSSTSHDNIKLWDLATGECIQTFNVEGRVTSIAISRTAEACAVALIHRVDVFDVATGEHTQTLYDDFTALIKSITFSPGGQLIVALVSKEYCPIQFWDLSTGECTKTLTGHNRGVNSLEFLGTDEQLISASWDGTVRIWDTTTNECMKILLDELSVKPLLIAYCHSAKRVASTTESSTWLKIWDSTTWECVQVFEDLPGIESFALSPTGNELAIGSDSGTIWIYDTVSQRNISKLEDHISGIRFVGYDESGERLVSSSKDNTIQIWDANARGLGKEDTTLGGPNTVPTFMAFSKDGENLISCDFDLNVKIWSVATGECMHTLQDPELSCDLNDSHLMTDRGRIDLDLSHMATDDTRHDMVENSRYPPPDIGPEEATSYFGFLGRFRSTQKKRGWGVHLLWITYDGRNVIRLPSDLICPRWAEKGQTICIADKHHRIHIFGFSSSP